MLSKSCTSYCSKYMLVGPRSPSRISLLSQAHQIEYYDHWCNYLYRTWLLGDHLGAIRVNTARAFYRGGQWWKVSSILRSKAVRLCMCPPVCCVCVRMSMKGQWSLSGWDPSLFVDSLIRTPLLDLACLRFCKLNGRMVTIDCASETKNCF